MIRHVVLMRFREDCPEGAVAAAVAGLRTLPGQVPEIASLTTGPDLGIIPEACDLAIVVDFASAADYQVYAGHPAHLRVIQELLTPFVKERHRAQFELSL